MLTTAEAQACASCGAPGAVCRCSGCQQVPHLQATDRSSTLMRFTSGQVFYCDVTCQRVRSQLPARAPHAKTYDEC
jgi:hypothetical protein